MEPEKNAEQNEKPSIARQYANSMLELMELRDPMLASHSRRVAETCGRLALLVEELPPEAGEEAELAALLHDLGFLVAPIVSRNSFVDSESVHSTLLHHAVVGHTTLRNIDGFDRISEAVLHHHERYDGTGFPDKLWRKKIPVISKIIAVVDRYDGELLRGKLSIEQNRERAKRILEDEKGKSLDPEIVNRFFYLLTTSGHAITPDPVHVMLSPAGLRPGMVLARPLDLGRDHPVIPEGITISENMLQRITAMPARDMNSIIVYIREDSIAQASSPDIEEPPPSPIIPEASVAARVLVVDDSAAVCNAIRRELQRAGIHSETATHVSAAMSKLEDFNFDALITDLRIGDEDGFEFLKEMEKHHPQLHVVVISGYPNPANIRALQHYPRVVQFIAKPWDQSKLRDAVHEAIDQTREMS